MGLTSPCHFNLRSSGSPNPDRSETIHSIDRLKVLRDAREEGHLEAREPPCQKGLQMIRSIGLDIIIVHGNAGLVHARSLQMRSLMLMGRSEDELWQDMDPVLRDLFDIQGDKVVTMTIDRSGRRVSVDVE